MRSAERARRFARFDAPRALNDSVCVAACAVGMIDSVSGAYIESALIATGAISNSMIATLEDADVSTYTRGLHVIPT